MNIIILEKQLIFYLEKNHLIIDLQYAFRHRRSTDDLLTHVIQLCNSLKKRYVEHDEVAVNIRISKAFFDRYYALLNNLWMKDFLSDRSLQVEVGVSFVIHSTSAGVSQGAFCYPPYFFSK